MALEDRNGIARQENDDSTDWSLSIGTRGGGLRIQKLNSQGQIYDPTVMLRPSPAVTVLRNQAKELAEKRGLLGDEYWNLAEAV